MGRSPTSPELHPSTQGSWNPPLQLERVDLSSLIFHFHPLDSYYSLYNFSIQISVISRWDSGAHTSTGRTRHGKEMSGVRLPAVETMSQFLCAHGPQDSRFRVEAQQPGGEGCLLRAVIHGGSFSPGEVARWVLHWRWVNLCTCQSTAHNEHEFQLSSVEKCDSLLVFCL